MIDLISAFLLNGLYDPGIYDLRTVDGCDLPSFLRDLVYVLHPDPEKRRLHLVEPAVYSDDLIVVALARSVISKDLDYG